MTPSSRITFLQGLNQGTLPIAEIHWLAELPSFWIKLLSIGAQPLTFYVTFSLGLRPYLQTVEGLPYWEFLFPALIAYSVWNEAFSQGAWVMWLNRWHQGTVNEYRIKPVPIPYLLLGDLVGGTSLALSKGLLIWILLLIIAQMGVPSLDRIVGWLLFMLPGAFLFHTLGAFSGVLWRKPDHISRILTLVITPMIYLGGLFFPVQNYPDPWRHLLRLLPSTWLFEGLRAGWETGLTQLSPSHWMTAVGLWGVAFALWAAMVRCYQTQLSKG